MKNLLKLSLFIFLASVLISPIVVSAQPTSYDQAVAEHIARNSADPCASLQGVGKVICQLNRILNTIIPFLMTLGVLYFVWGVVQYVIGGSEESKKKGREQIIYGLIGLAVIVGVWGLVNIITNTFGLAGDAPSLAPLTEFGSSANCTLEGKPKFQDLLCYITRIINDSIIPLIFTLAVLMFVWGVVQYVIHSDEETKKAKGKQFMIWGIVALTVMVSVWGLVNILSSTFGINGSVLPQVRPSPSP
ncbi:hypothetical protein A2917_01910 [Candidatus Nomurabacteria bacterium RIFCSPLOWO2_01_FULL_42_17]|uniref:Yip1 domain-containing protein n=1 Tax=Candidatus Nomurabacteria bacterium RIFCSPLOWO2_01_FULL_42_17 TaxID=1801780 RepID=A0A1F6XL91_9BACT|nr:MAG: hypothetical protein A2917_01910 [Candidatus Nomurabacteria bacterium RIFCSPLOWO2_01_FULL_42_17]